MFYGFIGGVFINSISNTNILKYDMFFNVLSSPIIYYHSPKNILTNISKQKFYNKPEVDPIEFFSIINEKLNLVNMSSVFLSRNVNEGFSGGEKKRNEILQMILLESELSILDETDSGLDIDALKIISKGINSYMNQNKAIILITHYQRLLDYVKPDYIHVMQDGKIIKTGNAQLAEELEKKGYEWLK